MEISVSPDRDAALSQYRARASVYDFELVFAQSIRRLAVERLRLKRCDVVLDVGCGTGLSFAPLEGWIGAGGSIIGIEQSPDMLAQARKRIERHGWRNVEVLESPVEEARIPRRADAALFHFTHDILQTPAALENVFRHLKPGARVVAAGLKWAPEWALPVNLFVLAAALRSTTALGGLNQPWRHLARFVSEFQIDELFGRGVYFASGIACAEVSNQPQRFV
jgi:ubiquinone/menaquinone biosynthesis C-methylase UbiE